MSKVSLRKAATKPMGNAFADIDDMMPHHPPAPEEQQMRGQAPAPVPTKPVDVPIKPIAVGLLVTMILWAVM